MIDLQCFIADHELLTRRYFLRMGVAGTAIAGMWPTRGRSEPTRPELEEAIAKLEPYFTPLDQFRDVCAATQRRKASWTSQTNSRTAALRICSSTTFPSSRSARIQPSPAHTASEARASLAGNSEVVVVMQLAPPRTAALSIGIRSHLVVAGRVWPLTGFETEGGQEVLGSDSRHDRNVFVALF